MRKTYAKPSLSGAASKGAILLFPLAGVAGVAVGALLGYGARLAKSTLGAESASIPRLVSLEVVK